MITTTHAYLDIRGGKCIGVYPDLVDIRTASLVAEAIRLGGYVERVPLGSIKNVLFEAWPPKEGETV